MTEYIVSSDDLSSVANTIRGKSSATGDLIFPEGFNDAVKSISSASTKLVYETTGPLEDEQLLQVLNEAKNFAMDLDDYSCNILTSSVGFTGMDVVRPHYRIIIF